MYWDLVYAIIAIIGGFVFAYGLTESIKYILIRFILVAAGMIRFYTRNKIEEDRN